MRDVRSTLANDVAKRAVFVGITIMVVAGVANLEAVIAVGFAVLLVGILFEDAIERAIEPPDADRAGDSAEGAENERIEALRDRYARGEIDHEEFERRIERRLETESSERIGDRETIDGRDLEREKL
ncbi:MAG: putative membrane protein [Halobacteriales archaeon]|jgi:uncharacterized membrane protein